jgi:hypothetical protein
MANNMKKSSFKNYLFFLAVLIVSLWTISISITRYKIYSSKKRYYRDYVKITRYNFSKYKQTASISLLVKNLGRRLLDSIIIKIDYYDTSGRLIGTDVSDILEITKSVLYPGTGKMFRIDVTCPEETFNIRLSIK